MLKRILGINKLEKNFKIVGESLNRSWEWINHLNKKNELYDERIKRLEQSNMQLINLSKELLKKLQEMTNSSAETRELKEESSNDEFDTGITEPENINLSNKDLFLLQLIHQYAAFNRDNAIDTNTLYNNLTYKITSRGLRKKLSSLVDSGFLRSAKKGNVRYWYLNSGALAKIKKALKEKE